MDSGHHEELSREGQVMILLIMHKMTSLAIYDVMVIELMLFEITVVSGKLTEFKRFRG